MSLEFFNELSGILEFDLSEPARKITERLLNMAAPPTATITALRLKATVYEDRDFRALTPSELDLIVLDDAQIRMAGLGEPVLHHAPNGRNFSVRDLLVAVEETERQTRGKSEWFGGVDVEHRFFEGIELDEEGVWRIIWGS
ncbi:MAG: hypothetical protein HOW73_37500 [Polyangiaceae bacterium]|nr:hypothetical protein [Polyangiaceae bacterium]